MRKVLLVVILIALVVCGVCVFFWIQNIRANNNNAMIGWAFGVVGSGGIGAGACFSFVSARNRKY